MKAVFWIIAIQGLHLCTASIVPKLPQLEKPIINRKPSYANADAEDITAIPTQFTPTASRDQVQTPFNACTRLVPDFLTAFKSSLCSNATVSSSSYSGLQTTTSAPAPALVKDAIAATTEEIASSSTSQYTCGATDAPCNLCAYAYDLLDICYGFVDEYQLDSSYVVDCLCYEAITNDPDELFWSPNYYDVALQNCPAWASSVYGSAAAASYSTETSLCNGFGNWYAVPTTDLGTYAFQLAVATNSTGSGDATASPTSSTGAMASNTSVANGGASQGIPYAYLVIFLAIAVHICTII